MEMERKWLLVKMLLEAERIETYFIENNIFFL